MSQFDPPPMYVSNPPQAGAPNAAYPTTNNNEQLMKIAAVALRGFCLLFSFLCFVIILTVKDFNQIDAYNYVLAAAVFSIVYNALQTAKGVFQIATRRQLIPGEKASALIDFIGDQVITYMVLSASSVGLGITDLLKQVVDSLNLESKEVDKAAGATSMLFFAFLTIAVATLLSAKRLFQAFTSS